MNNNITVERLIKKAVKAKFLRESKNNKSVTFDSVSSRVDFILAKDKAGFNFGSVLVRNSNYSRFIFKEMWKRRRQRNITKISIWFEQAVFTHLTKVFHEMSSHIAVASQQAMNAYPGSRPWHYTYKPGDFIVHFPGPVMKKSIKKFSHELVKIQPELKPAQEQALVAKNALVAV
jgi:hypothetical protein